MVGVDKLYFNIVWQKLCKPKINTLQLNSVYTRGLELQDIFSEILEMQNMYFLGHSYAVRVQGGGGKEAKPPIPLDPGQIKYNRTFRPKTRWPPTGKTG